MKVSIIVPAFNSENYLEKCINSILNQTYKDIEVIIINDGSIDNTAEICTKLELKDKRVKAFHQENSGVARARNFGLKKSSGEYICWVDSDDWIEPTYIGDLVEKMQMYSADMVMVHSNQNRKKDTVFKERVELIREFLLGNINSFLWTTLIKKDFYNGIEFEDIKIGEDALLLLQIFTKVTKLVYCYNNGYHYILRNDSTSLVRNYVSMATWVSGVMMQKEIINENFPELKKQMNYKIIKLIVLLDHDLKKCDEKEAEKLQKKLKVYFYKNFWKIPWYELSYKQILSLLKLSFRFIIRNLFV